MERCSSEEQRRKLEQSFRELPRISAEKLENVLGLFKMLIDYIVVRELAVLQGDRLRNDIDRYLERHCTEPIRLPEMAKKLGRSVSTISQFLRRNYRTSFKELLTERRLAKAEAYWMANPDATVGETAFAAGFSDQLLLPGIQAAQGNAARRVSRPSAASCDSLNQKISRGLNLDDFPKSRNTGLSRARL